MKQIYFDTETDGLYGPVKLVQLYDPAADNLQLLQPDIDCTMEDVHNTLKETDQVVGHNLMYDFSVCNLNPDDITWDDTFLLSKLAWPGLPSYALDKVMTHVYKYDPYEQAGLDKKSMQKAKWGKEITPDMLKYASLDVTALPKVYEACKNSREHMNYKLDKLTVSHFYNMAARLPVFREKLQQRFHDNEAEIYSHNVPINVNSYKQVREYLNTSTSDDAALAEFIAGNDADLSKKAKKVRRCRKLRKLNSFITKYLDLSTADNCVHTHLNVATVSGRSNSAHENLQQVPSALKDCFGSRDKYLVYADYSNLELRTFCAVVGERTMERLLREERDLHTYTAGILFNKPEEEIDKKTERQIAKVFNFSSMAKVKPVELSGKLRAAA